MPSSLRWSDERMSMICAPQAHASPGVRRWIRARASSSRSSTVMRLRSRGSMPVMLARSALRQTLGRRSVVARLPLAVGALVLERVDAAGERAREGADQRVALELLGPGLERDLAVGD